MSVLVLGRESDDKNGPRPMDVVRDLDGISRLIDLVFAEDIAVDGWQFQRDLAMLSAASPFLWGLRRISPEFRDAFDGFVWLERGRIVGNVTLARDDPARHVWTITNVAVDPDYRRRGIARSLMQEALAAVRQRGGGPLALEVRAENQAALDLYGQLGFRFVDGVATFRSRARVAGPLPQAGQARLATPADGPRLFALALSVRSADAQLLSPVVESDFQPTTMRRLWHRVQDLLRQEQRFWLVVDEGDRLTGAARARRRADATSSASITLHPDGRGRVEDAIIQSAIASCSGANGMSVQVGSDEQQAHAVLSTYDFRLVRTLHRLMLQVDSSDAI